MSASAPKRSVLERVDAEKVRAEFPIFHNASQNKPLVYLDTAASAQKPQMVIDAEADFYATSYANIHRGVYQLSQEATHAYEKAREKVQRFLNAAESREIVFTRGTTEAINLVAQSFGRPRLEPGDEILITEMEHHSNIVPWQIVCEQTGAVLRVVPIDERGQLEMERFAGLLGPRTKLVAVTHVSNALGSINPIEQIIELAHARDIPVLVDGAQSVPHTRIDLQALDCDFFAFSGHKLYGPTGIGALYAKAHWLEAMPPYQGGGEMILSVSFEKTTYNHIPHKFEAGTPHIAGAVGLGAALDYVDGLGWDWISAHETELLQIATQKLAAIPELRIIGTAQHKAGVISFVLDGIHPHDIGTILDQDGVAIRAGHHCAQPVLERLGVEATARASFGVYNTCEDIEALVASVHHAIEVFR